MSLTTLPRDCPASEVMLPQTARRVESCPCDRASSPVMLEMLSLQEAFRDGLYFNSSAVPLPTKGNIAPLTGLSKLTAFSIQIPSPTPKPARTKPMRIPHQTRSLRRSMFVFSVRCCLFHFYAEAHLTCRPYATILADPHVIHQSEMVASPSLL